MSKSLDALPSSAGDVARAYPAIWKAYSTLVKRAPKLARSMGNRFG
jgi:hypothetical protein